MSYPLPPPISIPLTTLPSQNCNYLPGRLATTRAFRIEHLPGEIYHDFMDAGFRRSGQIIYQPICQSCQKCIQFRILVDQFAPSKSQRRAYKRNADLAISVANPKLDQEKADLYARYVSRWHEKAEPDKTDTLEQFLYQSPVDSLEFCYRDLHQKLIGVGIADVCSRSLSSVYFYFDPDESHRSLGTFSAAKEIEFCQQHGIPHYYLGFWVNGCTKMQYKSRFEPAQILGADGVWREFANIGSDI